MDSSINYAKPYKEKPPPRRKAPVRKPRAKKEADIMPVIKSLISPVERQAIRSGQARLVAETEKASATKIQQAIRNKKARDTVSKMKAEKEPDVPDDKINADTIIKNVREQNEINFLSRNGAKQILSNLVSKYNKNEQLDEVSYGGVKYEFDKNIKTILKGANDNIKEDIRKLDDIFFTLLKRKQKVSAKAIKSANIIGGAFKAKQARATLAKLKAESEKITVPVPTPKKEKKPKYKISYASALKEWNMGHNRGMWCNPRVGTDDHKAVVALRL